MDDNNNKGMGKRILTIFIIFAIIVIGVMIIVRFVPFGPKEKTYDEFWAHIKADEVTEIKYTSSITIQFTLKDKKSYRTTVSGRTVVDDIYKYYVEHPDLTMPKITNYNTSNAIDWGSILQLLSIGIAVLMAIFLILYLFGKNGQSGAMNFGKTKNRIATNVKVRFTDVAGAEEEKVELKEIVDFLKNPKKFSAIGARIPRGVLLVGPPGTGKTLFAKAVAGEANVPFFSISGSDFVEMFVGVGASRVRDLFAQAKRNMPCIVFIDEIDAVGRQRGAGLGGGNDEREQTLNQLLVQMDGFDTNDGIIVMAATNRADILDPALLRPGRFDRQIYVNIPDVKGREEIFKVHARNKPLASDIDFKVLARMTSGFSGADIANLLNEAAILAARANRNVIIMKDILEGINKVIAGPQKKSRVITESDKRITSYHESGHAVVGKFMKYCDDVQEVSIIPRGMAAGYTLSRPKNDNSHVTLNKLNDEIAMLLGGRASEEIFIQDISTGASNDIQRATELARRMVTEWGMSPKLPNLYYGGSQEVFLGRDYQTQVNYGDDVAKIIDEEIQNIITVNYKRAYDCINNHKDVIEKMVRLLYERETIYADEVDMIIEGKSIDEINEYIDARQSKLDEEAKKYDKPETPVVNPPFQPASTIIVKEEKKDETTTVEPESNTTEVKTNKTETKEETTDTTIKEQISEEKPTDDTPGDNN